MTTDTGHPTTAVNLIGLTGYQGSGKDTAAEALATYGFQRYALASPIKDAITCMFDLPPEAFEDRVQKEAPVEDIGRSPRYLAQTLGTEWGRRLVADDLWVRVMLRKVRPLLESGQSVVVTDVRFDNEARAIHQLGGVVIRISRPSVQRLMRRRAAETAWRRWLFRLGLPIHPGVHPSEFGVCGDLVDANVMNDRSAASLAAVIRAVLDDLPARVDRSGGAG